MNKKIGIIITIVVLALLLVTYMGSTYNTLVRMDEGVKANWSQVLNQYKRRTDLIGNLVATVQGYATHEKSTLQQVVEARAKATQTVISPEMLSNPAAMEAFQNSQSALSSALSRLMVVVEKYPDLKANQNFLSLQSQLEGTENRIAVARKDYIDSVRVFNTTIRVVPTAWVAGMLGMEPKATFEIKPAEEQVPVVSFK